MGEIMTTLSKQITEAMVSGISKDSPYHKYTKAAAAEMSNKGYHVVYSILLAMENGEDEQEAIRDGLSSMKDIDLMKRVKSFFDKHFSDSSESASEMTLKLNVGKGSYNSDLRSECSSNECKIIAGDEVIASLIGSSEDLKFTKLNLVSVRMTKGSFTNVSVKIGNKTMVGTEVNVVDSDGNTILELTGKR